jgi:hypothetical protein
MSWLAYCLTYRIQSPVHIGCHKLGMIQRTRLYVPGKAIWGAASSQLTRLLFRQPNAAQYAVVGDLLRRHCRFTYFFPAFRPDQPLLPSWDRGGLRYKTFDKEQDCSEDELVHCLVSTFASTAIDPFSGAAEEASLHELEFLAPRRLDNGSVVFLVGYVFIARGNALFRESNGIRMLNYDGDVQFFANGMPVAFFGSVLRQLVIGGEKTYGWGQVEAEMRNTRVLDFTKEKLWGRCEVSFAGEAVRISLGRGGSPGGIETSPKNFHYWQGPLQPQVGRDWHSESQKGAGRLTSVRPVILSPGARWSGHDEQEEPEVTLGAEGDLATLGA